MLKRYVVYVDSIATSHFENKAKAQVFAGNLVISCANQDDPYFPEIKIVEEEIK